MVNQNQLDSSLDKLRDEISNKIEDSIKSIKDTIIQQLVDANKNLQAKVFSLEKKSSSWKLTIRRATSTTDKLIY